MSWNGTVQCRYCGATGHNSRTCPDKTETYRRRAQAECDNGEGREGYWHQQYAKRTGKWLNGDPANEMKAKRRGSTRRCKYCNKTGHNSRTCEELKQAKAAFMDEAIAARQIVAENMRAAGLGIGALIKGQRYGTPVLYMVESFHWGNLNHETLANGQSFLSLKLLTGAAGADRWHRQRNAELPKEMLPVEIQERRSYYDHYEIAGPVAGGWTPPAGWLEGEDIDLKQIFAERQSPNHYENRWE